MIEKPAWLLLRRVFYWALGAGDWRFAEWCQKSVLPDLENAHVLVARSAFLVGHA